MKRLGVVGSMVWDTIYDRDPAQRVAEEWGGISYSLAGLDATLPADWQIVPLIKVGADLAGHANAFFRSISHFAPGSRFILVPEPNNRVTLHYTEAARRCEQMSGGVPAWTWPELGPMVRDLDAVYVNFISGYEMDLATAQYLRRGFGKVLYADLHSLFLGKTDDGTRIPQPLPNAPSWFRCFDYVQVNEDELGQLGPDPLQVAATVLAGGTKALIVTRGAQGVEYFTGSPVRAARIPAERSTEPEDRLDPTGCGDVFGATAFASLLGGASLDAALATGVRLAARNLTHRGATGLRDHLLGKLARV
ncbi:MAG TPA: carbohydrate kinase family protein [Gemmatimonadales bacterium]|nr:carbohydrate kinase family protein [Gemmatimonadales bacterium]